jgi:hypothetical protein
MMNFKINFFSEKKFALHRRGKKVIHASCFRKNSRIPAKAGAWHLT